MVLCAMKKAIGAAKRTDDLAKSYNMRQQSCKAASRKYSLFQIKCETRS